MGGGDEGAGWTGGAVDEATGGGTGSRYAYLHARGRFFCRSGCRSLTSRLGEVTRVADG